MKRSRLHRGPSFKVPNRLILDTSLSFSARRMGAVLYSRRNRLGACTHSLANLAKLAPCSRPTARKALVELEDAGYITRKRNYKYDEELARLVYTQCTYRYDISFRGGFTFIPWSLFGRCLKRGAFLVCLYLYCQTGNKDVVFPSLNDSRKKLCMGKSTLCTALSELEAAGLVYVRHCVKANWAFSHNSYFFLNRTEDTQEAPCVSDRVCDPIISVLSFCAVALGGDCPGPFPCLYYWPVGEEAQVISGWGVVLKLANYL